MACPTNVDSSSGCSLACTCMGPISQEVLLNLIRDKSLEITHLRLLPHFSGVNELTHWCRVTHICVSKVTNIGSDNGFLLGRRQAIIWTNAGVLLIRTLGTNFREILNEIHIFSFKKMHWKMSFAKWRKWWPQYVKRSHVTYGRTLKPPCHYTGEILVIGCTGSCENHTFRWR